MSLVSSGEKKKVLRHSLTYLLPLNGSLMSLDLLKLYFLFPQRNVCFRATGSRIRVYGLSEGGEVFLTLIGLEIALQYAGICLHWPWAQAVSELHSARHCRRQSSDELEVLNQKGWVRQERWLPWVDTTCPLCCAYGYVVNLYMLLLALGGIR